MNPKPSEILRPLLDERGNIKGDSDDYRDKLFGVLDTLDTQRADLERRVAALEAKPATAGEGWPKWTDGGNGVYRWSSPTEGKFFAQSGYVTSDMNEADQTGLRTNRYPTITHEQAIAICPAIAKTYPLPTAKPPLTVEPVVKPDLTPEPASEPAPASVEEDGYTAENAASLMAKGIASAPPMFNVKRYIKTHLTAFAARAVSREKARADALQAWKEKALGALGEHPDTELNIHQRISDIRDEGRAHFHTLGRVQEKLDAAERRAAELEKAIDGTCAHLAAAESEVRRLREDKAKLESKLSTVRDHLTQWNEATTNAAANMAMSNAFNEVMT